jgi:hypothetical protein
MAFMAQRLQVFQIEVIPAHRDWDDMVNFRLMEVVIAALLARVIVSLYDREPYLRP